MYFITLSHTIMLYRSLQYLLILYHFCLLYRHFSNMINVFCEFVPQVLFLSCTFLFLVVEIFYKWIAWDARQPNLETLTGCSPNLLIGESVNQFYSGFSRKLSNYNCMHACVLVMSQWPNTYWEINVGVSVLLTLRFQFKCLFSLQEWSTCIYLHTRNLTMFMT